MRTPGLWLYLSAALIAVPTCAAAQARVTVEVASAVQSFAPLAEAPQLTSLTLKNLWRSHPSLQPLGRLRQLQSLLLHGQMGCLLDSVQPLLHLTKLTELKLQGFPRIDNVAGLSTLVSLQRLVLEGAPRWFAHLICSFFYIQTQSAGAF